MKIKKEIIITGGSGFLGKYLSEVISEKFKIISVDKKKTNIKKKISQFNINLKNYFKNKNLNNTYCIIHLATSESRANIYKKNPILAKKNIDDLIYILEKIKKQKNKILLIFASSRDVEKNKLFSERDLYSFSKEYSENLIKQYSLSSNFIFNILRMPDLFEYEVVNNPRSKALYKIVENLKKSKNILIDNPDHTFEYISKTKIINIIKNIIMKEKKRNIILSIKGEKINIIKLVKTIRKFYSSNSKIILKKTPKKNYHIKKIIQNKSNNFFKKLILS